MRPAQALGLPLLHWSGGRASLRLNRPDPHERLQVEGRLAAPGLLDAEVQASAAAPNPHP